MTERSRFESTQRRRHDLKHGGKVTLLYSYQAGAVHAEVWGPRIGFAWRRVELFRCYRCPRRPGKWLRTSTWRTQDLTHVARCVAAVKKWQAEYDDPAA